MRKLFYVLSFWIAFFLGGIFYTLSVKASAAPTLDPSFFNVVTTTSTDFFQLGLVPQGLSPYSDELLTIWNPWNAGGALLSFDIDDCEIEELSSQQKTALLDSYSIIDSSDLSVTVNSPIYSVHFDNGYFDGYAYVDDHGKLLSYTNDLGGHLLQLKYGGSIKSTEDWEDLLQGTATQVYESNFNLYDNPSLIQGDYSYYLFIGSDKYSRPYYAQELYIPNQYQPGVVVPANTSNGSTIYSWYTNNPDLFTYNLVYGTYDANWNSFTVTSGTYSKNNVSYSYRVQFKNPPSNTNSYYDWIDGVAPLNCTFAKSGTIYSTSYESSTSSSVAFKPLQLPQGSEIINYNYYYDPTSISRLEQALNNLTQQLNSNFNPNQQLSDNNFPFYYPANDVQNSPSEIPFPSVQNYPSYVNPLDPATVPMPDPATAPSIGSDVGEVDPANLRSGIPLINNLLNRFPFSIPWDIYGLLNGLDVPREIPYIHTTVVIPVVEYEWVIDYDLSDFDGTARLFRTLFLISYVIGLAYFSYDHFFGS